MSQVVGAVASTFSTQVTGAAVASTSRLRGGIRVGQRQSAAAQGRVERGGPGGLSRGEQRKPAARRAPRQLSSSESDERLRASDGRRRIGGKSSGVGAVVVHVGRRSNLVAQTSDRTSRSGRDAINALRSSSDSRRAPDGLGPGAFVPKAKRTDLLARIGPTPLESQGTVSRSQASA